MWWTTSKTSHQFLDLSTPFSLAIPFVRQPGRMALTPRRTATLNTIRRPACYSCGSICYRMGVCERIIVFIGIFLLARDVGTSSKLTAILLTVLNFACLSVIVQSGLKVNVPKIEIVPIWMRANMVESLGSYKTFASKINKFCGKFFFEPTRRGESLL